MTLETFTLNATKFDIIKTVLKSGTYVLISTAGSMVITNFQNGMDIKQSLIIGISVGLIAGLKNILKHGFNIDLDLTRLKQ